MARMMFYEANNKATVRLINYAGAPRFPLGERDGITHAAGRFLEEERILRDTPQAESATYNPGLQCTAIPNLPINTVKI